MVAHAAQECFCDFWSRMEAEHGMGGLEATRLAQQWAPEIFGGLRTDSFRRWPAAISKREASQNPVVGRKQSVPAEVRQNFA